MSVKFQEQLFSKTKDKLTFFDVIAKKPVEIVLEQMIDNVKQFNRNYVTLYSYDCSDATNKTDKTIPLSLITGETLVTVAANRVYFELDV